MKWIKKIGIGFLSLLLINLIGILAIACNLKTILVDGVIKEVIKEQIIKNDYKEESFVIGQEEINQITDDERIRELLNTKEIQDLINKYLDIVVDGLIDENNLDEVEIEKDILQYIRENKEVIESVVGKEVTDEMIEKTVEQYEGKEISRNIKTTIANTSKTMTKTEKVVLKGYKTIISLQFKLIIIALIILDLILIALLQKSLYKWVKTLGTSSIISGIITILISIIVKMIIAHASTVKNMNTTSLLYAGIGIIIIGLLLTVIYKIIENIVKSKKVENHAIS